ncbi:MAG TPA: TonB-dependent receptor [Caulobacteraceae bacterium]|jgi:hypothetical protein|nr:TonB-dependent receptor [Caulobacteraceae bacterium]
MLAILAAAAAASSPAAAPAPAPHAAQTVEGVEITTRRPVTGTLEQGVQGYRPEFFTPARPSTAMDMIQWLPGFTFEDMRDLRGLGDSGGNVLIDGKPPTSKNDTLATVLRRIPSVQVERVDIIVGSAPGIDMRGRPVIANVILKKTMALRGSVQAQTQVMQDGRVAPELQATFSRNAEGRATEASVTVNQRIFGGPGFGDGVWVRRDGTGAVLFRADDKSHAGGPSAVATGSYELPFAGGRLKVNGSGRWYKAIFDDVAVLRGSGDRYTLALHDLYRQAELGARFERTFGLRTTLEAQALQRLNAHDQTNAIRRPPVISDFDEADDLSESVLRTTLRFKKDETLTLETSAEGSLNVLATDSASLVGGVAAPIPNADVKITEHRGEAGGLLTWKPAPAYGVTAGLKLETSTLAAERDVNLTRTLTHWKPRLVLSWSPAKNTQVRLRAEREIGQINFYSFVAISEFNSGTVRSGNPNLRPQRSWVGEAVLERQFWDGASIVLTARRKALYDVVDARIVGTSGAVGVGNIGDGAQTDLVGTLTFPLKRLGLNGAMLKGTLTKSRSRVTDPTTGIQRQLSNWSATIGELHFVYDLPRRKLNLGFDAFYNGPFTLYRPAGTEDNGVNARLSVFVEYRYRPNLTFRLEGMNVTGARITQTVTYYAGPRNVSPLLYADEKTLGLGPSVLLRARRTF